MLKMGLGLPAFAAEPGSDGVSNCMSTAMQNRRRQLMTGFKPWHDVIYGYSVRLDKKKRIRSERRKEEVSFRWMINAGWI